MALTLPALLRRALGLAAEPADTDDTEQWLDSPAGCCRCGTGGPYYQGRRSQVTRYLYTGAMVGSRPGPRPDWSSCSRHPLSCGVLLVDYGADVVKTMRETEADAAQAWAARSAVEEG